ncbi:SMI1/KNR4 family protein [Paenibacillus mesophilus]|uniref:SMI1/KNR4 family protein n=1 Tax=Paenibacillus mesophilus TaxID=2582849 RepID=UPI001305242F|nr:SMI1/KNR4 family protein [Paenibacillus mesophilus]
MTTLDQLKELIDKHRKGTDFTGGITDEKVMKIEEELHVKLPDSYTWFLKNYGRGGLFGVDILGWGKGDLASVVKETERYYSHGLPSSYVVVEDCDEFLYCVDTDTVDPESNEAPVLVWNKAHAKSTKRSPGFAQFFINRLLDALEDEEFQ